MSDHLSPTLLNALADGELSALDLADANQHLAACPACTSSALYQSLLKTATARAGQRHSPPPALQDRLARLLSEEALSQQSLPTENVPTEIAPQPRATFFPVRGSSFGGWAAACAALLVCVSVVFVQRNAQRTEALSSQSAAFATEVADQHIATLAANSAPQVVSTDRHTVKPWFQGKLPFSFNLPAELPAGITLDGANLTYLHNQPTAQLLFSIGKHRASVFVQQRANAPSATPSAERSGFHIASFTTPTLEAIAVSDSDPARLADLVTALQQAQTDH